MLFYTDFFAKLFEFRRVVFEEISLATISVY